MAAFYIGNQLIVIPTAGLNAPFCSDLEVTEVGQKLTQMLTFWSVRMVDIYGCWKINLLLLCLSHKLLTNVTSKVSHYLFIFCWNPFFSPFIHACSRYIWNAIAIMPTCKQSSALRPPKRTQKITQSHMQSPAINTKWMLLMSAREFIDFFQTVVGSQSDKSWQNRRKKSSFPFHRLTHTRELTLNSSCDHWMHWTLPLYMFNFYFAT